MSISRTTARCLACLMALSGGLCLADVNMGYVSFDVTNPPLAEFDISNQTGPNATTFPDTTFPVTTSVSLSNLTLTVNFTTGPSQVYGPASGYFTLGADGISYDGAADFNTVTDPVTSATLTGTFDTTALTLNDGSSLTIDPSFSVVLSDATGVLQDGDFVLITASPATVGAVPEPASLVLLGSLAGAVLLLRYRRKWLSFVKPSLAIAFGICLLAASSRGAVKLNAATSPSTGVAGSSDVWVTGSGFPSGTITGPGTTITLATSCGGTVAASTTGLMARQIVGSSDRVEFQIPGTLSAGTYFVSISGTTSTGNAFASSNCSELQVTRSSTTFSACNPGSSMGIIAPAASGSTVTAYVPNGAWEGGESGIRVVPIEGSGSVAQISTPNVTNSCSSNSGTGETVCTANNTDIYLIQGASLVNTLSSSASGSTAFTGGYCQNCGVAVNPVRNQAVIQIADSSAPGSTALQFLDLATNTLGAPVPTNAQVSEDILWDPFLSLILSPSEGSSYPQYGDYALFQVSTPLGVTPGPSTVAENANNVAPYSYMDSAGEDCSTGIALATEEFSGYLFITDLKQATFSGGTWNAPGQNQYFPEFADLAAGTSAIAVAPGTTHLGVVAGEFGGNTMGFIQLPATSGPGAGTPSVLDYVYATLPNDPDGFSFSNGDDPHTTTAYTSPTSGKAYAVAADWASGQPKYLAVIDIQAILSAPRSGPHTLDSGVDLIGSGIVRYIATQ